MYHIYSTLANGNDYVRYSNSGPQGVNVAEASVTINGGAGINQRRLQTPLGVHTAISDEDYEWLKEDFSFKRHVESGHITVRKAEAHPDAVAADMATRQWIKDASGNAIRGDAFPITPEDFRDSGAKEVVKPVVNKKSKAS